MTIAFIGAGKVGCTLARLLYQTGYLITAIYSRQYMNAKKLAEWVNAEAVLTYSDVVQRADWIFLTVPDDAIAFVVADLAHLPLRGKTFVHTSGVSSLDVMQPLIDAGAQVGSFHPAFPFSDIETAMQRFAGTTIAVEYSSEYVRMVLEEWITALKGFALYVPAGSKALYHASLVIASNYLVTLYAISLQQLQILGASPEIASNALLRLMDATLANLHAVGTPQALTGPLVRSDLGTIDAHMQHLPDDLQPLYRALARHSYPMLIARGIDISAIEERLQDKK